MQIAALLLVFVLAVFFIGFSFFYMFPVFRGESSFPSVSIQAESFLSENLWLYFWLSAGFLTMWIMVVFYYYFKGKKKEEKHDSIKEQQIRMVRELRGKDLIK